MTQMKKKILVTGGAGYIGSHTCHELCKHGYEVIVIDNLSNSTKKNINTLKKKNKSCLKFIKIDLLNIKKIENLFKLYSNFYAVIHFAGLKSVPDSIEKPSLYYENNVLGTLNLISVMQSFNCKRIVFSSSATVYSEKNKPPLKEKALLEHISPYGHSKILIESMITNLTSLDHEWRACILRYFNPAGADNSGIIGEEKIKLNNLFNEIISSSLRKNGTLKVFGKNYNTKDGTAIRDYVHVSDIAEGHLLALKYMQKKRFSIFNLGSGKGYTVLDVVKEFEKILLKKIPKKFLSKRKGDAEIYLADISNAKKCLKWHPKRDLNTMCKDALKWYKKEYISN